MIIRATATIVFAATIAGSRAAAQTAAEETRMLDLASSGRAAEAWSQWAALAQTDDKLRFGITLAIASHELPRGVDVYDDLSKRIGRPDPASLSKLAVAVADALANDPDLEARLPACAAALALNPADAACRKAIDDVVKSTDSDERAFAYFSLVDVGVRVAPAEVSQAERAMSPAMRLRVARVMTRLPAADRVFMLQPILSGQDNAIRYQAMLVLGTIPGAEAAAALQRERGGDLPGPLKNALLIGLARHGDAESLDALTTLLPLLSSFEKAQAAAALAEARRNAGATQLQTSLQSGSELERLATIEAVGKSQPEAARRAAIELLTTGTPAVRQRALFAAGALEFGTDPAVYRRLTDPTPAIRAAAVAAIQQTLAIQQARGKAPVK